MQPSTPPNAAAVEVVATQPTEADTASIAQLSAEASKSLPPVAYLIKVRLEEMPPVTSEGWALYIGDFRVPKYWEYQKGIYFKVFDPAFFVDHQGEPLRFSQNGTEFVDTGLKLAAPRGSAARSDENKLPLQSDVLK
jgi:hypothetical protein